MKRQSIGLWVLLASLFSTSSVLALPQTITVGPGGDYATIQQGMDAANPGDTVLVYAGTYPGNINFNGKVITVRSFNPEAMAVIQGTGLGSVVTFSGSEDANCLLSDFTVTGGNTPGDGGGICGNGTEATIANCVMTGNHADGYGGGVNDCNGTLVGCTISGNTAGFSGGGLNCCGGSVMGCTVVDNSADHGGGIFCWSSDATIENCEITGNSAAVSGGGVYWGGVSGAIVKNCLVRGNSAVTDGGGISCDWYADVQMSNCTIADNTVTDGRGGGIYCSYEGNAEVIDSIIWGNRSTLEGSQLALSSGDVAYTHGCTVSVTYSDVQTTDTPVDAIYVEEGSTLLCWDGAGFEPGCYNIAEDPLFVAGYYLSQLAAGQPGESPCADGGSDLASNLGMDGRTTRTDGAGDGGIVDMGYHYGEAVAVYELTVLVVGAGTVEPNSGFYFAGTVVTLTATPDEGYKLRRWTGTDADACCRLTSTVTMDSDKTVTVEFGVPHVLVVPGHYGDLQQAIDAAACGDVIVVNTGLWSGDIHFNGKNVIVTSACPDDPVVVAHTVLLGSGTGPVVTFSGCEDETCVLLGLTITGGNTPGKGGGIYVGSGASPTIAHCVVIDTDLYGGNGGTPGAAEAGLNGDAGEDGGSAYGGGIYIGARSSPTILQCRISRCRVFGGNGGNGANGGDWNDDLSRAGDGGRGGWPGQAYGGGIFCASESTPTFLGCTIEGCEAIGGNGGDGGNAGESEYYSGCGGYGGSWSTSGAWDYPPECYDGLYWCDTLDKDYFVEGELWEHWGYDGEPSDYSGCGGGVYCDSGSEPTFIDCTINNNTADGGVNGVGGGGGGGFKERPIDHDEIPGFGGGMFCAPNSSPTLVNCLIHDNDADSGAGVVCDDYSSPTVGNCTIAENVAVLGGGGLFCGLGSGPVLTNSIVWGNSGEYGGQIYSLGGSPVITYCDIEGGHAGEGNINSNPMFVDANAGDWHLGAGSPCIDAGDNNSVPPSVVKDLDGNARIINGVVDMGPYENTYYYVDGVNGDDNNDGRSPETAFATIQKGIDTAEDGCVVLVFPAEYLEPDPWDPQSIDFLGKNIKVTSAEPGDWDIVESTVIRGIVLFDGSEDANCVFTGFTVSDISNGAIYGNHTHATISHCIVSGNGPCSATVIENCDGTISNCLITDNLTIYYCGVYPVVMGCHGVIKNCTIANNASGIGILDGGETTIENCIVYRNGDPNIFEPQILVGSGGTLNISYSNLQGGLPGISSDGTVNWGLGNIEADPCFVRLGAWGYEPWPWELAEGDYHLKSEGWRLSEYGPWWVYDDVTSRSIDWGNPGCPLGEELMSIPRDPDNMYGVNVRINMGAYGGTAEASMAPHGWVLLSDLDNDGATTLVDLGRQAEDWLRCESDLPGDLNRDGLVNMKDYAILAAAWELGEDMMPPTPNPMQWDMGLDANGFDGRPREVWLGPDPVWDYGVTMRADPNTFDWSRFEFYFECTTQAGFSSGWISFPAPPYIYTVKVGLNGQSLNFRVKAGDLSPNHNETAWSTTLPALPAPPPPDTFPPAPPPYLVFVEAISPNAITMHASTAYDSSGVEYYFECVSGGGSDSGWQDQTDYTDANLVPETEYCYRVKARDKSANQNETGWSDIVCQYTAAPPLLTPPTPNPMRWDYTVMDVNGYLIDGTPHEIWLGPDPVWDYYVTMRADPNTYDESGFEFYFECTNRAGFDSGWISFAEGPPYIYTTRVGLMGQVLYFRVKARDLSPSHNETAWSQELPMYIEW
ncbi:MAG TPA: right-handed parallel beta-helix repeat-containing protein [Sedimentisphaerales bacterium]|nr:right-handed parallel beta-helix repeat-containing protein [Sedimentisphaerales bacterium]